MREEDEGIFAGFFEVPRGIGLVFFLFCYAAWARIFTGEMMGEFGVGRPSLELAMPLIFASIGIVSLSRARDRSQPLLVFLVQIAWIGFFGAMGLSGMRTDLLGEGAGPIGPLVLAVAGVALMWRRRARWVPRLVAVFFPEKAPEVRDPALGLVALAHELPGATVSRGVLEGTYRGRALRIELVREGAGARYEIRLGTSLGAKPFARIANLENLPPPVAGETDPKAHEDRWRALFRIYAVREITLGDGALRATVPSSSGALTPADEGARLERLLARLGVISEGKTTLDLVARESAKERCPYCHDALATSTPASPESPALHMAHPPHVCTGCGTPHHSDCFAELGGCAVLGCPEARGRRADRVRA